MANQHHLDLLQQGPEVWNEWKRTHPYEAGDFSAADQSGAFLYRTRLMRANLREADLREANLSYAHLHWAILCQVSLDDALLRAANLYGADLSGARLLQADLQEAILTNAFLKGAVAQVRCSSAPSSPGTRSGKRIVKTSISAAFSWHPGRKSREVASRCFPGSLDLPVGRPLQKG